MRYGNIAVRPEWQGIGTDRSADNFPGSRWCRYFALDRPAHWIRGVQPVSEWAPPAPALAIRMAAVAQPVKAESNPGRQLPAAPAALPPSFASAPYPRRPPE